VNATSEEQHQQHRRRMREQIERLAEGSLGRLPAWRLRRHLAACPDCTQEYEEVTALFSDLRAVRAAVPMRRLAPAWPVETAPLVVAPTLTLGGITMKRRTALIAACGTLLLFVTGAISARSLLDFTPNIGVPGAAPGDWWYFEGRFRGNVEIQNYTGRKINRATIDGSRADAGLKLVLYQRDKDWMPGTPGRIVAEKVMNGPGRYPVKDAAGRLWGYVVLSPFTAEDEAKVKAENDQIQSNFVDYYRRPERVTPSGDGHGFYHVVAVPGLTGGYFGESVDAADTKFFVGRGASFKVYGQARVTARYHAPRHVAVRNGNRGEQRTVLPARVLTEETKTGLFPSPEELREAPTFWSEAYQSRRGAAAPEVFWQLPAPNTEGIFLLDERGKWRSVRRSGGFTGYGRHVVRDEAGRELLVLEVSPLTVPAGPGTLSTQ